MSPLSRVLRTVGQVLVAVAAAVPAAVALLDISAARSAQVVGICGATVVIVTAVQNALEAKGTIGTVGQPGDGAGL